MVRKTTFLLGAVLAPLFLAACVAPVVALADTYLDGTLSERDACLDVGMYSVWRSTTGRELNGYDSSQSMYSDTNLAMIHEWNQDFRRFNIENGNAINTTWPVSEVHDIVYLPATVSGSYQYDDLRSSLGQTYDDFRYRYPDASANGYQINYGGISNPLKALMSGFALSNSSKEYGDISDQFQFNIAIGIVPQHEFIYNGQTWYIGRNEEVFTAINSVVNGSSCLQYTPKYTDSYLLGYMANTNENSMLSGLVYASNHVTNDNTWTELIFGGPLDYVIGSNGYVTPVRDYIDIVQPSINQTTISGITGYRINSTSKESFLAFGNTSTLNGMLFIPVAGSGGFAEGGGENNPTINVYNPGNYINVPGPNSTVNIYQVTNDPATNGPVTDTNTGLGWLGDLLNLLIDGIRGIGDFVSGLAGWLLDFITDFVIGDLDSIDLESLKLPDLTGVFPFSIPWDVANVLGLLDAEPLAPSFDFPVTNVDGTVETVEVDLADFDPVAGTVRTLEVVAFVVGLALATRRILG